MTIRRFRPGERITSLRQPLNQLVEQVNSLSEPRVPPSQTQIRSVRELEIKTLNTDDLTCVDPGEAANVDAFEHTVKIPLTFTEASRGAVNYTYTDINNRVADGTENQELTPVYQVGDIILVTRITTSADAFYHDLNVDGRQWAKV